MLTPTATPQEFFRGRLETHQARYDVEGSAAGRWTTLDELLADDAAQLRSTHVDLVASGVPPKAAANHLAAWVGGALGDSVAFTLALTGAGVLADARTRWRLQPGGWPDRTDVSASTLLVADGHRWQGLPGVRTARDGEVAAATAQALVTHLTPYVEACSRLARVSRASLWAQVADGIGAATAADPELAALGPTVPVLEELLATPGVPWRKRPRLWHAPSAVGPVVVARKGGCCLAYLAGDRDGPTEEAGYCSTCPFRDCADVEARIVGWAELVGRQV